MNVELSVAESADGSERDRAAADVGEESASSLPEENGHVEDDFANTTREGDDHNIVVNDTFDTVTTSGVEPVIRGSFDVATDVADLPLGVMPDLAKDASFSSKAVTAERKHQLILEARESRRKWLGRVPVPYRIGEDRSALDGPLHAIEHSYALTKLPTAAKLLNKLYDVDATEDSDFIREHVRILVGDEKSDVMEPTGREILEHELSKSTNDDYLIAYSHFWKTLHEPACSTLVQSMRKNLRLLKLSKEKVSTTLRSGIDAIFAQLQQQAAFRNHEQLKRCLEAFVYGQCYQDILALYTSQVSQQAEADFQTRLDTLQFLTPKHLDANVDSLDPSRAVSALKSMDTFFSAYDKLQRVLVLYQSVNNALRQAMQADGNGKSPSADDVLPAIIFVVIKARPRNLLFNLQIVEELASQEYLRGEAGYAFTNLYGAVQFLLELDLEQPLNMSPSEWKQGLEESMAAVQERRSPDVSNDANIDEVSWPSTTHIPPMEIRKARERGEAIDLEWARRWHDQHNIDPPGTSKSTQLSLDAFPRRRSYSAGADITLPPGFSRSYTYLTARPEDLRCSDLGPLLDEYKLLVQTTEALLAERADAQRRLRKASAFDARKEYHQRISQADISSVNNSDDGDVS